MKNILLITLVTLLFTACGSTKRVVVVTEKENPSWYKNPPVSNEKELYALAEGTNKKEAIANALGLMVSTLGVSISSNFSSKTTQKDGKHSSLESRSVSEVKSSVEMIKISHYDVVHSESLGFKRYSVLVHSNKKKLFLSMKHELDQIFSIINTKREAMKHSNGLKELALYKKSVQDIQSIPNRLLVMNSLDKNFTGEEYLLKMKIIETTYEKLASNISFRIEAEQNVQNLIAPISKGLSDKGFGVKNHGSKVNFKVSINATLTKASSYGFSIIRAQVNLVTKGKNSKSIGSNSIHLVGQSTQSFEVAKQNLTLKLDALIAKVGISKVLGLDI